MSVTRRLSVHGRVLQDLRYAFRALRRDSGSTTFCVRIIRPSMDASTDIG